MPEKYEFKLPEGMSLDQALVDKISPIFKEAELTQAKAQEIVNVYSEHVKNLAVEQEKNLQKFSSDLKDETIKALGADYKAQLAYVAQVRDRFFSQETQELLDASTLSNNKAFIFDLIKLGKQISENVTVKGKSALPKEGKSAAELLYPNYDNK